MRPLCVESFMPVPIEYARASEQFYAYLLDARDTAGLWSTHVTYTMTQGVLQTFRRRLTVAEALQFAEVLPIGLRALFVSDWNTEEERLPFSDRASMTAEVKALRAEHNFSTDNAIQVVALALRRHVDEAKFDAILARLPAGAAEFWQV